MTFTVVPRGTIVTSDATRGDTLRRDGTHALRVSAAIRRDAASRWGHATARRVQMSLREQMQQRQAQKLQELRDRTGCVTGASLQAAAERAQQPTIHQRAADVTESSTLSEAVNVVLQRPSVNDVSLIERLTRRVGLGDDPKKRRTLFSRLDRLHRLHRETVESLIAEAWAQAAGARRRDRYFCRAICAKLAESGLELGRGAAGGDDAI